MKLKFMGDKNKKESRTKNKIKSFFILFYNFKNKSCEAISRNVI